jgi:hypothetical protein
MQIERENKLTPTYAAIRIWPETRTLLRKIGHKTQTYDQIIRTLINSYREKEETMLHRARQSQDWTPVTYGKLDATKEESSSPPNIKPMTSKDDFHLLFPG